MPQLDIAAQKFDIWMKKYVECHQRDGDYDDNNKALVDYLNCDRGFRFVKTYEDLCQLAMLVQAKGYNTNNPPCTPAQFGKAVCKAEQCAERYGSQYVYGDKKPIMPDIANRENLISAVLYKRKCDKWASTQVKKISSSGADFLPQSVALCLIASSMFKNTKYKLGNEHSAKLPESSAYPSKLASLGVRENKATGPRVLNALK